MNPRIKLDENMPAAALAELRAARWDVDTVAEEGLAGESDATVWAATQAASRFLVTQDLDFADSRRYPPGTHAGVLVIRRLDGSAAVTHATLQVLTAYTDSLAGALIVTDGKRVRFGPRNT